MPLLVSPDPDSGLQQGDLLRGTSVYQSGSDGDPLERSHTPDYLLVISRNCNAVRDAAVIVSPVLPAAMSFSEKERDDFRRLRKELEVHRDGGPRPDRLYLGDIEGRRYATHLDELYMLVIPGDLEARRMFISERRILTLDPAYLFDLHSRLFLCFSRRGFDDVGWFSDADLGLVIDRGNAQLKAAQAALAEKQSSLSLARTEGGDRKQLERKINGIKKQIDSEAKRVQELSTELEPLIREQQRRRGS